LPASALPAGAIILEYFSYAKKFAVNGKLSLIALSQLRGAVLWESPNSKRCVLMYR